MEVRVGIKTVGAPIMKREEGATIVENMLIGDGFHWQRVISARLPGSVETIHNDHKNLKDPNDPKEPDNSRQNISLINTLPLETYLECVVGSEMNPSSPPEFLKAHAVISRNWVAGKILQTHFAWNVSHKNDETIISGWDDTGDHTGFHVCSDDHCQRYQGLQEISPIALEAIRSTASQFLLDKEGRLIDTRFSKCCGGVTELFSTCWQNVKPNSIESFQDPWCDLTGLDAMQRKNLLHSVLKDYDAETENYGYRWTAEISKEEIRHNLKEKFGRDIGSIKRIEILHRGPSGRADLIEIKGSDKVLKLGKELWIRRLLSGSHLYSSAFEIEDTGNLLILHGRGWGHGVGLCQIGAANMAMHGHDYRRILSFYYPGSILSDQFTPV